MAYSCRRSLNSLSDSSAPSSDLSEGSNYSLIIDNIDLHLDSLSLDTNSVAEITNNERNQIETFFSGLGTEVNVFTKFYCFVILFFIFIKKKKIF